MRAKRARLSRVLFHRRNWGSIGLTGRGQTGNAKIQGMVEDLNMQGSDYNVALLIFFIPYVLFEGMAWLSGSREAQ